MSDEGRERGLSDADIVALVGRYLDGVLTAEEQSLLFERLRCDGRAQTLFVRSLMQAAYLNELLAQQRSGRGEAVLGGASEGVGGSTNSDSSLAAFGLSRVSSWLTGWRGMGLVATGLVVLGLLLFGRGEKDGVAEGPTPLPLGAAVGGNETSREVFDPRSIHLTSGSARVTLPKVGYMLVDGPADVDLVAPLRAKLNRGRIRVRVTEKSGRGFVVETPDGDVVDLSTEFGLDVTEGRNTGVVVFDGAVDLHWGSVVGGSAGRVERLTGGEGVTFNRQGAMDRVGSIMTGNVATFLSDDAPTADRRGAVIVKVADNLRSEDTKKFYEIVPGGFGEDALAYVDRPGHEWNGATKAGLPKYLLGADYVKTFSDDDVRADMTIRVWLSRPAKLYVLYDSRLKPPKWLESGFRKIRSAVGMDLGPWPAIGHPVRRGVGPGNSVEHGFRVWERVVKEPGVVTLGGNATRDSAGRPTKTPYMYGIAAVALEP